VPSGTRNLELRESPAVRGIVQPGDRIVASTLAFRRSWPLATIMAVVLALAFFLVAVLTRDVRVTLPLVLAFIVVNLAMQSRQKFYFVGITEHVLACHKVSRLGGRATRLLFTAPLPTAHVTVGSQTPLGWSVRCSGPDPGGQCLRLFVGKRSAEDLDEVLGALRAGGASVTGPS